MSTYESKLKNISTILHWMEQNLSLADYLTIDRETLAKELELPQSALNRTLLILENQGVIGSKRDGSTKAYKLIYSLEGVTSEDVCAKIDTYNQASNQRSQQKKLSEKAKQASVQLSIVDTVPDTMPPLPALPLTPGQLLMQQAQAMLEAEKHQKEQPVDVDERLKALEQKMDAMLSLFQQTGQISVTMSGTISGAQMSDTMLAYEINRMEPLPNEMVTPGDQPVDPTTTRGKIVQIVNSFSVRRKVMHRNIWTWLYKKLRKECSFSPADHRENDKERLLDVVERCNQLDNLYQIARRLDLSNEG